MKEKKFKKKFKNLYFKITGEIKKGKLKNKDFTIYLIIVLVVLYIEIIIFHINLQHVDCSLWHLNI